MRSPLQQIHFIRENRFFIAEKRDQDTQSDRGLSHRVRDHKNREDLPVDVLQVVREGDEIDVHRIQDQLDGHQDNHDVAAGEHTDGADEQQCSAQRQVMRGGDGSHAQILFFAMTTEPTTATSSSTEAISKGSRYWENSTVAIRSVLPSVAAVIAIGALTT